VSRRLPLVISSALRRRAGRQPRQHTLRGGAGVSRKDAASAVVVRVRASTSDLSPMALAGPGFGSRARRGGVRFVFLRPCEMLRTRVSPPRGCWSRTGFGRDTTGCCSGSGRRIGQGCAPLSRRLKTRTPYQSCYRGRPWSAAGESGGLRAGRFGKPNNAVVYAFRGWATLLGRFAGLGEVRAWASGLVRNDPGANWDRLAFGLAEPPDLRSSG